LHLDLRFDVLKKVTVTFPSEKVFSYPTTSRFSSTRGLLNVRGANLAKSPAGTPKIISAARYRESLAQFI
jgi:hypothetical protein